jgi:hypothetical protein
MNLRPSPSSKLGKMPIRVALFLLYPVLSQPKYPIVHFPVKIREMRVTASLIVLLHYSQWRREIIVRGQSYFSRLSKY